LNSAIEKRTAGVGGAYSKEKSAFEDKVKRNRICGTEDCELTKIDTDRTVVDLVSHIGCGY
jgi:hypothetical protein